MQRAQAYRLDVLDVDLIFTADFVDADGAAHGDVEAIFGAKLHQAQLGPEADALDLRAVVFQRAIHVAGLWELTVGEFAFDEDVGEVAGQEIADSCGQLADGKDAALGHEVELKLAHARRSVGAVADQNGNGLVSGPSPWVFHKCSF